MTTERGRLSNLPGGKLIRALWQRGQIARAISGPVSLGRGVRVGAGTVIRSFHGLHIEDRVAIGRRCTIEVSGTIGYKTIIAANVGIVGRSDHAMDEVGVPVLDATWVGDRELTESDSISIGKDVWIGYGAILLSGVTIGDCAVIAAGAVVVRDVAPFEIVGGNPARQIGERMSVDQRATHIAALTRASAPPSARGSREVGEL